MHDRSQSALIHVDGRSLKIPQADPFLKARNLKIQQII